MNDIKYKNPDLPVEERVDDLLARMTFNEKIDQITCLVTITPDIPDFSKLIPEGIGNVGAFTTADHVEKIADYVQKLQDYQVRCTRLGIPALIHCEACAGAQFTEANVFPSAIAQASTFDPDLIGAMAELIARQLKLVGFRQALSPVMDIARDPRWGRMTETYGEDPALVSAMTTRFTQELQKQGIVATAKHFVGHGAPEGGLNMGRSIVSERELAEVHCKPFQSAITDADLGSVMEAYSSYDGEPVVGSHKILTDLLRGKMGFAGFAVSDYVALDRLIDPFRVADDFGDAGVRAMKAGLDVEYPRPKGFTYELKEKVDSGELSQDVIDQAVRRVLRAKFAMGLFEDPYPHLTELKNSLHQKSTDQLNEKIACESITMLKNRHQMLPLERRNVGKIAIIGPHADSLRSYFGTFSYPACLDMTEAREAEGQEFPEPGLIVYDFHQEYPGKVRDSSPKVEMRLRREFPRSRTLYQALKEYLPEAEVVCAKGINVSGSDLGDLQHALDVAADADMILLTLGGKNGWGCTSTVGEGVDSTDIGLPGRQEEFAQKVYALRKPTVVLHFDGRPLSSLFVTTHFDAILEVWQPGEMGGQALCRILFGESEPGGRLPVTVAKDAGQIPCHYALPRGSGFVSAGHTGMIRNPQGYYNESARPLYGFGHGLTYTTFSYSELKTDQERYHPKDVATITLTVKNAGNRDGDEVVQLYFCDEIARMVRPTMEMAGFCRVHLTAGESRNITFSMKISQTAFLDESMQWTVERGKIRLMAGAASDDIRCEKEIEITETAVIDGKTRGFYTIGTAEQAVERM